MWTKKTIKIKQRLKLENPNFIRSKTYLTHKSTCDFFLKLNLEENQAM
jgi:hypothetical protein